MPFQKVVMIFNVDSTYQISSKSVNWFQSYSVFEFLGSILTIKKIEFSKKLDGNRSAISKCFYVPNLITI